jgi:hypothetical protein
VCAKLISAASPARDFDVTRRHHASCWPGSRQQSRRDLANSLMFTGKLFALSFPIRGQRHSRTALDSAGAHLGGPSLDSHRAVAPPIPAIRPCFPPESEFEGDHERARRDDPEWETLFRHMLLRCTTSSGGRSLSRRFDETQNSASKGADDPRAEAPELHFHGARAACSPPRLKNQGIWYVPNTFRHHVFALVPIHRRPPERDSDGISTTGSGGASHELRCLSLLPIPCSLPSALATCGNGPSVSGHDVPVARSRPRIPSELSSPPISSKLTRSRRSKIHRKNLIVISFGIVSSASWRISVALASLAVSKLIPTPQSLQTSRSLLLSDPIVC